MIRAAAILAASAAQADDLHCVMENGDIVNFTINRDQFIAPQNPNDPPRRRVTAVTFGDKRFPADPILLGDTRGFHGEGLGGSSIIFIVQPDGAATYANVRSGEKLVGTCEDH